MSACMTAQLDVFRHSDAAQAAAYREAAKTARVDPYWTEEQRAAREAFYLAEALRLEQQQ